MRCWFWTIGFSTLFCFTESMLWYFIEVMTRPVSANATISRSWPWSFVCQQDSVFSLNDFVIWESFVCRSHGFRICLISCCLVFLISIKVSIFYLSWLSVTYNCYDLWLEIEFRSSNFINSFSSGKSLRCVYEAEWCFAHAHNLTTHWCYNSNIRMIGYLFDLIVKVNWTIGFYEEIFL